MKIEQMVFSDNKGSEYTDVIITVDNTLDKFDTYYPFKRGDFIAEQLLANPFYSVTDERMTKGVVIDTNDNFMTVKVLEHTSLYPIGETYEVYNDTEHFHLYSDVPKVKVVSNVCDIAGSKESLETFDCLNAINYKADGKTTTVTYKDHKAESICNLEVDEFNADYGLGLALERLGKMLQEKNPVKSKETEKTYVKITYLMNIDKGCGLHEGDIVEAVAFYHDEVNGDKGCYIPCKESTYGSNTDEAKQFNFPVQRLITEQYEVCDKLEWVKSDTKTDHVRIIQSGVAQREAGVCEGDVVKVLEECSNCLYVESKEPNTTFMSPSSIETEYFTFLGAGQVWEYVKLSLSLK